MRARLSALVLVPLATALVTLGLADTHAQQPKPTDQPSVSSQMVRVCVPLTFMSQ